MKTYKRLIILAFGLFGTEIVWKTWSFFTARRKNANVIKGHQEENNEKNPSFTEVLMFTEHCQLCRNHANARIPCKKDGCPVSMVRRIQTLMALATKTLDLCMYVMTCDDLTKAILAAHRVGVHVRVIVDAGMSENTACAHQITRMRRAGIKIRMNPLKPSNLMHHKFVIIDGKTILLGSTNWTMQAFYGNYDSIMITNEETCVKSYMKEFEKMWDEFEYKKCEDTNILT